VLYPPLQELMDKVDSRYTLVIVTAKRARQLIDGDKKLVEGLKTNKPVSIATYELAQGKITYERLKYGIK